MLKVTLKDVAKRAQVTPPVVSSVLHNKSKSVRVSEATAERVRQAAEDLGYRVNVFARNFRAQRTNTIGVLNGMGMQRPTFLHGPRYFAALMDGIVDCAFRHDYSVTLCPQLLGESPQYGLGDGRFDGLIWYSIPPSETVQRYLQDCLVPLVIIHGHERDFDSKYPTVICDNAGGIGLAVDHLVGLGHKKIGFAIESDAMNVESLERLAGFEHHMKRHGLPHSVLDVQRDRSALRDYLSKGPDHTALIVHSDGLAGEIIRAAPEFNVDIPGQLSVVGFDSTEFCDELRPRLTSVHQPLTEMGACATEKLMTLLAGNEPQPLESVLACSLDIRESTGPIQL
ncbi:MAG TPA: LacI family DNA-binding transcriptional regulator [Fimbriimonas sp.]|nr:LacI family DNA-binding transcriptional regulator [Fimbriimonas sp.]